VLVVPYSTQTNLGLVHYYYPNPLLKAYDDLKAGRQAGRRRTGWRSLKTLSTRRLQ
jgi:hypothetical protein